ncbi:MAG: hypothetical protein B6D46_03815 [Polyangiaceae bacterium UTPRO1]|jgi:uncharacterized protein (DUF1800 family)|nr:DUF1800 domain-containing protein [Myxococcales bacterium]OQY68323.1 MAG: hypothetical protein B6D46_03815 [Polyangiaceae bacterium UTPRO1]
MGDVNSILTEAEARHLMRRAGFGASPKELAKLAKRGLTRGQLVDGLLKFKTKPLKVGKKDGLDDVYDRWLELMLKTKTPLLEKLVLFWHDHFATANAKVQNTRRMAQQNALLRTMAKGDFGQFLKRINKDPAVMEFLDTLRNNAKTPNENYARELMELFSLGVVDEAGQPNYAQEDIVQIARAFSGWRLDDDGNAVFRESRHDFNADHPERGPKVIFKSHGMFGAEGVDLAGSGEGAQEIDAVIDAILRHRDSAGRSTVGRRITRHLFDYFAWDSPSTALVDELLDASGFATTWNIGALVKTILVHDAFYETAVPVHLGGTKKSVKWPVDFVVGTLRLLRVAPKRRKWLGLAIPDRDSLRGYLDDMGQRLFDPPSVFGWDWEAAWISSATLLARCGFVRDVAAARAKGKQGFHPEKLVPLTLQTPDDIIDAASNVLGIRDQLSPSDREVLQDYLTDGGAVATLDLTDAEVRNRKLHGLFALLMESPAYQLH